MPFITFDYRCKPCDVEEERLVLKSDMDAQRCGNCKGLMVRLPAGTKTTFKFADKSGLKS